MMGISSTVSFHCSWNFRCVKRRKNGILSISTKTETHTIHYDFGSISSFVDIE
jgi:hypothetical protein